LRDRSLGEHPRQFRLVSEHRHVPQSFRSRLIGQQAHRLESEVYLPFNPVTQPRQRGGGADEQRR